MMRIEMLETVKHDTPQGFLFTEGEHRTVDDEVGRLFVAKGWARDLDGQIETGARVTGSVELQVDEPSSPTSTEGP